MRLLLLLRQRRRRRRGERDVYDVWSQCTADQQSSSGAWTTPYKGLAVRPTSNAFCSSWQCGGRAAGRRRPDQLDTARRCVDDGWQAVWPTPIKRSCVRASERLGAVFIAALTAPFSPDSIRFLPPRIFRSSVFAAKRFASWPSPMSQESTPQIESRNPICK